MLDISLYFCSIYKLQTISVWWKRIVDLVSWSFCMPISLTSANLLLYHSFLGSSIVSYSLWERKTRREFTLGTWFKFLHVGFSLGWCFASRHEIMKPWLLEDLQRLLPWVAGDGMCSTIADMWQVLSSLWDVGQTNQNEHPVCLFSVWVIIRSATLHFVTLFSLLPSMNSKSSEIWALLATPLHLTVFSSDVFANYGTTSNGNLESWGDLNLDLEV